MSSTSGFPTIISFMENERCQAFQRALAEDGQPADIMPGRRWLEGETPCPRGPLILFLGDRAPALPEQSRAIERAGAAPLCLVLAGQTAAPVLAPRWATVTRYRWPEEHHGILRWLQALPQQGAGPVPADLLALSEQFADLHLIGRSPAFLALLRLVKRTARTLAPVLIQGETGTGKELVARAVHYLGPRQGRPFIPINCGALPDSLLESELFGYEKGAFTDAKESRPGLVELARGGTLFLDEIDSLSRKAQITFLRFLQDQQFRAVGGRELKQADVRLIAATNTNLGKMAARGEFRQDLLFRIAIVVLQVPALAARAGDVELLAEHFLRKMSVTYKEPMKRLSPATLEAMRRYRWPGNVRELENFIHRAWVLTEEPVITWTAFGQDPAEQAEEGDGAPRPSLREAKARALAECERRYLAAVLAEAGGNVTHAARLAGTERRALGKLLKKHGLRPDHLRP